MSGTWIACESQTVFGLEPSFVQVSAGKSSVVDFHVRSRFKEGLRGRESSLVVTAGRVTGDGDRVDLGRGEGGHSDGSQTEKRAAAPAETENSTTGQTSRESEVFSFLGSIE